MHDQNNKTLINTVNFDINGKSDAKSKTKIHENKACAKSINLGKKSVYHAKKNSSGKLFNPVEHDLMDKSKTAQGLAFTFKQVSKASFDLYLQYLSTGHKRFLICAEREL